MATKRKPRSNARDKTGTPRRVYSFGCKRPDDETMQFLRRQAMMAKDVQAAMIKNENLARKKRETLFAAQVPEYWKAMNEAMRLESLIANCYDEIAGARKKARKRVDCPELEETIERLKGERLEAWRRAAAAKRLAVNGLTATWEEFKQRKARCLEEIGSTSSRAKQQAHKLALTSMLEEDLAPDLWRGLVVIADWQNDNHCAIRRVDWRPPDAKAEVWSDVLDGDTKEMAREAFLQAASRTAAEGGRMRVPRGAEGRVGRMWCAADAPTIGADGCIEGTTLRLRLAENPWGDGADPKSRRSQLRKRMVATMKIGGREVAVPVLIHRQMPEGGLVRRAWFMLKSRGRVDLQLVVQSPTLSKRAAGRRLDAVAVKFGWAAAEAVPGQLGAITVAMWFGTDGSSGVVELDARTNEALVEVRTLRSHQDEHHNEALEALSEWTGSASDKPDWIDEALRHSHSWRSPRHLAGIAYRMRGLIGSDEQRETLWRAWKLACDQHGADYFLPWDETKRWLVERGVNDATIAMAVYLEWWRRKNRHLRDWECNMRETALRRRKDGYRVAAAHLARRYETLLLIDSGLKSAARKKAPEEHVEGPEKLWTRQRRNACPSELVACLANAFRTTAPKARIKAKTPREALERQGFSVQEPTGGVETAAE